MPKDKSRAAQNGVKEGEKKKESQVKWTQVPDPQLQDISIKVRQARKDEDLAHQRLREANQGPERDAAVQHLAEVKLRVRRLTAMKKPHRNRVMEEIKNGWWEGYEWSGPEASRVKVEEGTGEGENIKVLVGVEGGAKAEAMTLDQLNENVHAGGTSIKMEAD